MTKNFLKNLKALNPADSESGVILLVAVLILSGIMLIVATVSFFAIQEIRASRAVSLSEPAISAANSGAEQGIWAIKRNTALADCPTFTSSSIGSNSKVDSCKSYGSATLSLTANTPYNLFLYDPSNINGDIDLLAYPYTYFQLTNNTGTFNITVNVARLTGATVGSSIVSPGNTSTINIPAVAAGQEGRMKITITSPVDATVTVNTNRGMPEFPTVDASGCTSLASISDCNSLSEIYKRRLNVTVPQ